MKEKLVRTEQNKKIKVEKVENKRWKKKQKNKIK